MARRARAAGFPDSDVVVIRHRAEQGQPDRAAPGPAHRQEADPASLPHRRGRGQGRGLDPAAVRVHREGRHFLRPRRRRRQGRGRDSPCPAVPAQGRERFVPDRDIIVALTADEEGGPDNGVEWLLANRKELVDAEYAFNEGGGGRVKDGVRVSHDVQASEKKFQNFTFEADQSRRPQLGSGPGQRDHAPVGCAGEARRVRFPGAPERGDAGLLHAARRCHDAARWVRRCAPSSRTRPTRPPRAPSRPIRGTTHSSAPPAWPRCSRAATPRNALPQRARANVNCRILPDESPDSVRKILAAVIANPRVSITAIGEAQNSPPSPLTPALMGEIAPRHQGDVGRRAGDPDHEHRGHRRTCT